MGDQIEHRAVLPVAAAEPEVGRWLWALEVGRWLWALEDGRRRTQERVAGLDQAALDWTPDGLANAIGTLLYHIALIEADYLCIDVLGRDDYLPALQAILPHPDRDGTGRLWPISGVSLDEHLSRLDTVRQRLLDTFATMTMDQLSQPRLLVDWGYEISPAWTLHHLAQHEAEHRGEIGTLRTLFTVSQMAP